MAPLRNAIRIADHHTDQEDDSELCAQNGNETSRNEFEERALAAEKRLNDLRADLEDFNGVIDHPSVKAVVLRVLRAEDGDRASIAPSMINPAKDWLNDPPPRDWYIDDLIPMRNVTLIYGDGGHGKSLLAQQIGMAGALNEDVLGMSPKAGRVLYLAGEDEPEEVWRRMHDIVNHYGRSMADMGDFRVLPFAGIDTYLSNADRSGAMTPTRIWEAVTDDIADFKPTLVVYDTAANLFGGDEIKKSQVVKFVEMLKREAIASNHAAILLAHPSSSGIADGSGMGGNRAWSNSARSRLYMVKGDDGTYALTNKKINYAATGSEISFTWNAGAFSLVEGSGTTGLVRGLAVEKKFLELLDLCVGDGVNLSPNSSSATTYAPRKFSKMPEGKLYSEDEYYKAMRSLLGQQQIVNATNRVGGHERVQLVRPTPWNDGIKG